MEASLNNAIEHLKSELGGTSADLEQAAMVGLSLTEIVSVLKDEQITMKRSIEEQRNKFEIEIAHLNEVLLVPQ